MFGGSMMRFGDEDPDDIFGAHMQNMNRMMTSMNSMFANPFGMMGAGMMGGMGGMGGFGGGFMPPMMQQMSQMPNMTQLMSQMENNGGNCHSFSSSTIMSMTNGPDGRPQVYQATSETRSAPGGIKETKKAVCDSRTGVKKMAIGHAIGDKAHVIEREQNMRNGEQEERQNFYNLDEEESDAFNQEWQQKARQAQLLQHSINYPQRQGRHQIRGGQEAMLALPDCTGSSSNNSNRQPIISSHSQRNSHSSSRHSHPYKQTQSQQMRKSREHIVGESKQHQKREEVVSHETIPADEISHETIRVDNTSDEDEKYIDKSYDENVKTNQVSPSKEESSNE